MAGFLFSSVFLWNRWSRWVAGACALLLLSAPAQAGSTIEDISPVVSQWWGPTNGFGGSAGRVNGLASVPGSNEIFYAASEWGGLFKTDDRGVTWERLDDHLPVAVWDVEVDPVNPNIVYATSFYDGRAFLSNSILVSYDAGNTWVRPLMVTPDPTARCSLERRSQPSAFGIAIQPDAPNNVYIGTNCGLAMSSDWGLNWDFVDPTPLVGNCEAGTDACDVWDVVVQPGGQNGNGIVDICGEDGHWRTVDGGVTWTGGSLDLPKGRCSIAVSPDEPYVLFVADDLRPKDEFHHYLYESDDAGATWIRLGKPYPQEAHKRIPFVTTNQRPDEGGVNRFDLWYGEQDIFRVDCETPDPPTMPAETTIETSRCAESPFPVFWQLPGPGPLIEQAGAHGDAGDLVFDRLAANDACPVLFSSDGGVYINNRKGDDCHDPRFDQPLESAKGLWLWGMDGFNHPGGQVDIYFGTQDVGAWVSTDAELETPSWSDGGASDSFTIVVDEDRVVRWDPDGLKVAAPGALSGSTVNTPQDQPLVGFRFINALDRIDDKMYVVVKDWVDVDDDMNITGDEHAGLFITRDITASPVGWERLGTVDNPPYWLCGVRVATPPATPEVPTFYAKAGSCNANIRDNFGDELWKWEGVPPSGSWQRIDNNDGLTGGFGIIGVDPKNPNRLYASNLRPGSTPQMVFSNDGGLHWDPDEELDRFMTGHGAFRYINSRGVTNDTSFYWTFPGYPQPSLVAFDPYDANILVAGGRDSGVFLSTNGGQDWSLLTDPFDSGASGIPHIPRPWFAHFHHDAAGTVWIYIGTQGRGVWRIGIRQPLADAGGPYTTVEGTDVTLDAGGSSDPDGEPLTYEWDFDNDGDFDDATGINPVFSRVGQDDAHTVRVKVTAAGVFAIAETTVTVQNVPPTLSISVSGSFEENSAVMVSGLVTDPGWLDPLSVTIDWGDGTPPETIVGIYEGVRPDATLSFDASHVYGDNGSFLAQICAYDDDTSTCASSLLTINNVDPSAEIDTSAAILVNGMPTFLARAGEPVDLSGRSRDPGSDDLTLSWDWDDGPPSPDVTRIDLVNPPNPDPLPSPSIQPRDVTDMVSHAFADACHYLIEFRSRDDDGGESFVTADVIIVGNSDKTRSAGYWAHQYRGQGKIAFSVERLDCYLAIAGYMSSVFHEVRDASTLAMAAEILKASGGNASPLDRLDRQLLAAWLNFANGAPRYAELVDTDGDRVPDTPFAEVLATAEAIRLYPTSTAEELEAQEEILDRVNNRDKDTR